MWPFLLPLKLVCESVCRVLATLRVQKGGSSSPSKNRAGRCGWPRRQRGRLSANERVCYGAGLMLRRSIFLGGALALPLALRPGFAQQSPPATVRLGLIPSISSAQAFYADAENFFKKNGLDVDIQTLNNGATIAAAMAAGSLDV